MVNFFSTDVRRGWILCNIFLAACPILVTLLTASTDVYSVILSYCYALLVVGAYLFYRFVKNRNAFVAGDTWFWASIFSTVIILIILFAYNSNTFVTKIVNSHWAVITVFSLGTLVLAFFLAYKLNWPIISKEEAEDEKAREEIKKMASEAETAKRDVQEARDAVKAELEGKK